MKMEWEIKVYKILCGELTQLYKDGCFTDIIIQVDGKQFPCHKVVLSSFSPYFKAMFTVQMKESKESVVKLPFIDVATFERILDFMYSGKDVVTRQTAFELLEAASFMQIGVLQEKCEEILLKNISIGNCFAVCQFAKKLCCNRLEDAAFEFILQNFPQMSEGDTLLHMSLPELKSLFDNENLKIQNEDLVSDFILRWLKKDKEKRMSSAAELFKLLRLPFASGEYLFQQMPQEHPDMMKNEELVPYLEEAKQYHMMPARQSDFVTDSTTQRKSSSSEDVLIVFGGYKSVDNSTRHVSAYSLNKKAWSNMCMIPFDVGRGFATCTFGQSNVFISGGNRHSPYFLKFDGNTNKWTNLADLPSRQVQHNMIAVDKSVFLLGGLTYARIDGMWQFQDKSQKNVHRYDIQEDKWDEAGDLVHPVYGASSAVFRGKILIIGGKINCLSPERILAIQCYNPRSSCTTVITTHQNLQSPLQASGFDDNILLVSIEKRIMHVDPERTTLREIGHVPDFESHSFGVARQQGKLFILGGRARNEEDRISDCMVSFELESTQCTRSSMPFKRWDFGFVKILVKKSFLHNEIESPRT